MKFIHAVKILASLLALSCLFFFSGLAYYYRSMKTSAERMIGVPVSENPTVNIDLKQISAPQAEFNILLLGHGDPGHPGGDLADSLILVHINTDEKKALLVSIPRDTWLSVGVSETAVEMHKINEVYLTGKKKNNEEYGFQLIKQAVGEVTGLPIHYYIFIDFSKFKEAIDSLGGIVVEVPVAFDDYYYPVRGKELETCGRSPDDIASLTATISGFLLEKQFPCRYEHLHFEKGQTSMNGELALKFVRSRHSDQHGGDFARAQRQQAVILGIKDKLLTLNGLKKAPQFFNNMSKLVKTDIDESVVVEVASQITQPEKFQVNQLVLSTENIFDSSRNSRGQFVLIPKAGLDQWNEVHQLISALISQ